jgi:hypothetical protein
MKRLNGHPLFVLLLALFVAVGSLVSAARMAPAVASGTEITAYLSVGGSLDDLCGLPGSASLHPHCPFCHKLGDTPKIALEPDVWRLALWPAWPHLPAHQRLGPQQKNTSLSARGPPALA